jgi:uncharacterized peroxidase-related enzyme
MTWTRSIPPGDAEGGLIVLYDWVQNASKKGDVSAFWQALGVDTPGASALFALRQSLVDDPRPLSLTQVEMIAVVVSATNGCGYCVAHHGPQLAEALGDEPLARSVALDYRQANLTARDRVLMDYAVALTCEPSERKLEDVERLREYGLDDVGVVKATEITAYYNAVNRIASALGVKLEPGVPAWEFGAQK